MQNFKLSKIELQFSFYLYIVPQNQKYIVIISYIQKSYIFQ